jgi:cell wall-associated NlpC family hydrolase
LTKLQKVRAVGCEVLIDDPLTGLHEAHGFESEAEAVMRARLVTEALSWDGTPFRDCMDMRGPGGGVDCAMLLLRTYVDAGVLPPFDPRPYDPFWNLKSDEELFLNWIEGPLNGKRVDKPRIGDAVIYHYAKCFSHGAVVINSREIIHAYAKSDVCHVSMMTETDLCFLRSGKPRQRLYFEVRP